MFFVCFFNLNLWVNVNILNLNLNSLMLFILTEKRSNHIFHNQQKLTIYNKELLKMIYVFVMTFTIMFQELGIGLKPNYCHLSIDNSSQSLNYVMHNRNQYPSIPFVNIKENCEYVSFLLKTIDCNGGYTKQHCFLCLWDSGATSQHYHK